MKSEPKDLKSIAQQFFAAYDAHDVDGMLAFCAEGALGRYAPYQPVVKVISHWIPK